MITEETYEWIEELLDPKITEISDSNYNRLVREYFHKDKTDWFDKHNIINRVANIKIFWSLIRKFSLPKGEEIGYYNFKNFVFPSFYEMKVDSNNNFWVDSANKLFSYIVDFSGAIFLEDSIFEDIIFEESIIFNNTKFKKNLIIENCQFKKDVSYINSELDNLIILTSVFSKKISFINTQSLGLFQLGGSKFEGFPSFYNSTFHKKVTFGKTTFSGNVCRFNESIFLDDVEFFECKFQPKQEIEFQAVTFSKKVDFIRCEFWVDVHFNQSQFKGITVFDRPIFKEKADFSYCYFEDVNFKEVNTNWSYRDRNYTEPAEFYFKDVFFNSNTFIKNTDLTKLELDNCDITNITFSRCIWNDQQSRLKLVNEIPNQSLEIKNRLKLSDENLSKKEATEKLMNKLRDSENHYRQLKKNFDSNKSWELSGKAYVSEMEMRKRRLYLEGKNYQWFIYKFYDVFGGYTQDFRKPIVSLIGLILVFSGLYFFIDYDISNALQRGIKGALPYMKIDIEYPTQFLWVILRNLEFILGGTFLTFFILALRKRFKQ